MLETAILAVFAAALIICVISGASILYALLLGFALFFCYGLIKKHGVIEMIKLSLSGVKTVRNVLMLFLFIGMITSVWRACGSVQYIVYYATGICTPASMVLITFLLCCLVSFLTGTAFGTVATVGVICMTISQSMGVPSAYTGGAILAGVFFGDRCSPVSTSALLVCELTGTDIYKNIKNMVKTSLVPFALSCAAYLALGLISGANAGDGAIRELFPKFYSLHWAALIPALIILVLSLLRVNVMLTLGASIASGLLVAVFVQHAGVAELLQGMATGYTPPNARLDAILSGGGIVSMAKVFAIVCISSCYAGMFNGTGFLDGIRRRIDGLGKKSTAFTGTLVTSALSSLIACNQTLTIMLAHQLCRDMYPAGEEYAFASDLENTAVVTACVIPWSIACAVPLETVGAPDSGIFFACYLYLLPLWNLIVSLVARRRRISREITAR